MRMSELGIGNVLATGFGKGAVCAVCMTNRTQDANVRVARVRAYIMHCVLLACSLRGSVELSTLQRYFAAR